MFVELLEKMYDDLTDAASRSHRIYKSLQDKKLTPEAREILGKKRVSIQELLDLWIPIWKAENRLSANGDVVQVSAVEAKLLKFQPDEKVCVYRLCDHILLLFSK